MANAIHDTAARETVARNLKVERAKHGWTQEDLAVASGVSKDKIANIESCRTATPFDVAIHLALALGCKTDDLAGLPAPEDRDAA